MELLDAQRWRCSTCQYLNPIEATECVMCHSPKEALEAEWKDDWGESEDPPEPTDFLAAQAVEPKAPPQIVRAEGSESEEESEEDTVVVNPATASTISAASTAPMAPMAPIHPATHAKPTTDVPPSKPIVTLKRESTEAAGVVIRQKESSKGSSGPSKPILSLTKPAPIRIIPAGKGLKLGGAPPPRKPVVLKKASEVVKSDDLFAELGMNAQ